MDEFEEIDLEALKRLEASTDLESMLHPEHSPAEMAEQILQDAAPAVAASIVKIALNESNPSIRLRAGTYIIDRVLGKSGDGPTKQAPWESLLDAVTDTVSQQQQ